MITSKFSFWMEGTKHLQPLKRSCERWWELVASWLKFPFSVFDEENADIRLVDLLAWQRQIDRFDDEPESLYRKRVKYAFVNAVDAGTPAGMTRIFARFGISINGWEERVDGYEWDMIGLKISGDEFAKHYRLLHVLFEQYGRTCRRWLYRIDVGIDEVLSTESLGGFFNAQMDSYRIDARLSGNTEAIPTVINARINEIERLQIDEETLIAGVITAHFE